VDTNQLSE